MSPGCSDRISNNVLGASPAGSCAHETQTPFKFGVPPYPGETHLPKNHQRMEDGSPGDIPGSPWAWVWLYPSLAAAPGGAQSWFWKL